MKGCRPLSQQEIHQVARSFGGKYAVRNKALFLLGVKSGFRISELLSLRVADVIQCRRVVERVTVRRRNTKGKTEGRTLLLHPDAGHTLVAWVDQMRASGDMTTDTFVFRSRNGHNQPITRVQAWRVLRRAYATSRMTGNLGTHSMRKTFANRIYEKLGRDLVKTQRALGHRNINSTVSYLSFRQEDIDAAILAI